MCCYLDYKWLFSHINRIKHRGFSSWMFIYRPAALLCLSRPPEGSLGKAAERPAFLRGAENRRPGAALHSIHCLQGQRQSPRCHNIFHIHFNLRIYQNVWGGRSNTTPCMSSPWWLGTVRANDRLCDRAVKPYCNPQSQRRLFCNEDVRLSRPVTFLESRGPDGFPGSLSTLVLLFSNPIPPSCSSFLPYLFLLQQ